MALPFTAYLVVMRALAPATDHQWARADPILLLLPHETTLWVVPTLGVVLTAAWLFPGPLSAALLTRSFKQAVGGALVACVLASVLRVLNGPHLPSFIPPEESAGPGFLLNMTAGYAEELLFRIALLPLVFLVVSKRTSRPVALASAILVASLGFALLHQAGSGGGSASLFATRFLLPGCLMSAAALLISPSFVVVAHCTAHLLIPVFFTGV